MGNNPVERSLGTKGSTIGRLARYCWRSYLACEAHEALRSGDAPTSADIRSTCLTDSSDSRLLSVFHGGSDSLSADVGLGQTRADGYEEALVTLGADLDGAKRS